MKLEIYTPEVPQNDFGILKAKLYSWNKNLQNSKGLPPKSRHVMPIEEEKESGNFKNK